MMELRKYLPYLLFSCKKVASIISVNPQERTLKEQLILNYHKLICKACHNYQYQNNIIEQALSNTLKTNILLTLSDEKKAAIIGHIKTEV